MTGELVVRYTTHNPHIEVVGVRVYVNTVWYIVHISKTRKLLYNLQDVQRLNPALRTGNVAKELTILDQLLRSYGETR